LAQLLESQVWSVALLLQDVQNGVHDALVSSATAQVAGQFKTDACLVCVGQTQYDIARRGQHAGRAEPALQCVVAREGRPQQLHYRIVVIAFDGGDLLPRTRHGEGDAGAYWLTVEENGAGATDAVLTTEVRAGQMQLVAQEISEVHPWLGIPVHAAAVHLNGN